MIEWGDVAVISPEDEWSYTLYHARTRASEMELRDDVRVGMNCGCGVPGWEMPYDEHWTSLRKYVLPKHYYSACVMPSGVLEDHVHLLARLAQDRVVHSMVGQYWDIIHRWTNACRHGVASLCKIRTGFLKMGGSTHQPVLEDVLYWELGYGYLPYKPVEELAPLVLEGHIEEDAYLDMLAQEVGRFMTEEWEIHKEISIKDWFMSFSKNFIVSLALC